MLFRALFVAAAASAGAADASFNMAVTNMHGPRGEPVEQMWQDPRFGDIRNVATGVLDENTMEQDARSADPVKRARAFRQAFATLKVFRLSLSLAAPPPQHVASDPAISEDRIASPIGYYDVSTGEFREKERAYPAIHLMGQVHGDSITFKKKRCSGTLRNVPSTWEFKGPVSCGSLRFVGVLQLR